MITRNPSLTDQVKSHLKEQIINGDFGEGRMPPEAALAGDLGVSRTTIRDALAKLEHEGAIYRKQGAGTFVNPAALQIKSRLEEIWSYTQVLADHGYTPSVEVVAEDAIAAPDEVAAALGIEPGAELLTIEKVFLEDDRPVILTRNQIPTALLDDAAEAGTELPIYDFLEARCGRRLAYYVSEIVPTAFGAHEARALDVKRGTVGLQFVEVGYDADNLPVVYATSHIRDDLLRFRIIRRRGAP